MQSLRKLSLSRSSPALVRSVPALSRGLETFIGCGSSTGQIALRNAEQKSAAFSSSITETAPRVLSLQRDFLRSVPWIKRAYNVTLPEPVCADALEPRAAPEVSLPAEDVRLSLGDNEALPHAGRTLRGAHAGPRALASRFNRGRRAA